MSKKLNTHVHVVERNDKGELTGKSGTFGPDDDLSKAENAWVEPAISNPDVWQDGTVDEREQPAEQPVRPARNRQNNPDTAK